MRDAITRFGEHRSASELVDMATRRWADLEALLIGVDRDPTAISALGTEIRFGLQQALQFWPEHPTGRGDLDRVLVALAHNELVHENPDGAWALVAEHPGLAAELGPEIEAARVALAERAHDASAMVEERFQSSIAVGARSRMYILLAMAGFVLAAGLPAVWLIETGRFNLGYPALFAFMSLYFGVASIGTAYLMRKGQNRASKNLLMAYQLNTLAILVAIAGLWRGHAPLWIGLAIIPALSAITTGHVAIYSDRSLAVGVPFMVLFSLSLAVFRTHLWTVLVMGTVFMFLSMAVIEAFKRE